MKKYIEKLVSGNIFMIFVTFTIISASPTGHARPVDGDGGELARGGVNMVKAASLVFFFCRKVISGKSRMLPFGNFTALEGKFSPQCLCFI